jgi:HEAT repeat protein
MMSDTEPEDVRIREQLSRMERDLHHPSADVREAAVDDVCALRPAGAFEMIVDRLFDPDEEVRGTAASSLGLLGDPRAVPHLVGVVDNDHSEHVRDEALRSLAEFHDPSILRVLVREVSREKRSRPPRQDVALQLRNYDSDEAVAALVELLSDDDVFVRDDAVESLYILNRPALRDVWIRASRDASPDVRRVAEQALRDLDSFGESGFSTNSS